MWKDGQFSDIVLVVIVERQLAVYVADGAGAGDCMEGYGGIEDVEAGTVLRHVDEGTGRRVSVDT